jgi:trimeric autotransporter adhesin
VSVNTGTNSADFTVAPNTCSVNPGGNCMVNVTFTPSVVGHESATLSVTDNAGTGTQTISLSGIGVQVGPLVSLSPASLDFGNVPVGSRAGPQSVTLTNIGNADLNLSRIRIIRNASADSDDFTRMHNCPAALAPGKSCVINVFFNADADRFGSHSASLVITDNASNRPQAVPLSANAVGPHAKLSTFLVNFGEVAPGHHAGPVGVTLSNTGNQPPNIIHIQVASRPGRDSDDFRQSNNRPAALVPGSSCTIQVTFQADRNRRRLRYAFLQITDNAYNSPQFVGLYANVSR